MSQEITVSLNLNVKNPATGGGYAYKQNLNQQYTQNAVGAQGGVESIPTTATTISLSNLSTYGWALFQNLDSTNYVTLGLSVSSTYYPFLKLEAGEVAVCRLQPGITLQAQANTAAVELNFTVFED